MNRQLELVSLKKTELEKAQEEHIQKLEKIAKLTEAEAKAQLIENLKEAARSRRWPTLRRSWMKRGSKRIRKPKRW
jgi:hypothetical protein